MRVLVDANVLIDYLARRECAISSDVDYIITRNGKDFTGSKIPVLSPDDFLAMMDKYIFS